MLPASKNQHKSRHGQCGAHGARSLAEDRLGVKIRKDRGKIQVGLYAGTYVAAGMGIHRDDRLCGDLEIAIHPDEAGIDSAGRPSGERLCVPKTLSELMT